MFKDAFDSAVAEVQAEAEKGNRCSPTCNISCACLIHEGRCARAAQEKAESDREAFRVVALDCMSQYAAARREFIAAGSAAREQQQHQHASAEASHNCSTLEQLHIKCEEVISATYRHCDSQLKAWQQQRSQLLQAHSQSIQQLQVRINCCVPTVFKRRFYTMCRAACLMRFPSGTFAVSPVLAVVMHPNPFCSRQSRERALLQVMNVIGDV